MQTATGSTAIPTAFWKSMAAQPPPKNSSTLAETCSAAFATGITGPGADTATLERKSPMWTDANVELLRKLWSEGKSASDIAKAIGGGMTRNAVIGKVHRLGLRAVSKSELGEFPKPEPLRHLLIGDRREDEGLLAFKKRASQHNLMVDLYKATSMMDIKIVLAKIIGQM
jgi:hypothetical protein